MCRKTKTASRQVNIACGDLNHFSKKQEENNELNIFSLLLLLMSVIGSIKVPTDPEKRKELFKLDEKPELMKQLCSFMLDILLLPYAFIGYLSDLSNL